MESVPRGSDGRRLFSPEFKREQVARLVRGELTISELSRELGISRSVLQRWKQLIAQGGETAVAANEDVVPASELRAAQQRIRELERLIGKQAVDLEILRAARDEVKKRPRFYGVSKRGPAVRWHVSAGCSGSAGRRRTGNADRAHDATIGATMPWSTPS
jgi:transposase